MVKIAAALVLVLLMSDVASAQQRQFYDAAGRNAGRSITDSQGSTTFYDAAGRAAARSSTTGQTTTIYDAGGRVIERSERGKR